MADRAGISPDLAAIFFANRCLLQPVLVLGNLGGILLGGPWRKAGGAKGAGLGFEQADWLLDDQGVEGACWQLHGIPDLQSIPSQHHAVITEGEQRYAAMEQSEDLPLLAMAMGGNIGAWMGGQYQSLHAITVVGMPEFMGAQARLGGGFGEQG